MDYDLLIIGAGMSGLAAGIRAAYFGKRVIIVEKHSLWGGLNSFYKKAGIPFDVGLHAVTNWIEPGYRGPRTPLQRIYRQLRIKPDEFALEPQAFSEIAFLDATLRFGNGLDLLRSEIAARFPEDVAGFDQLARLCADYPNADGDVPWRSSRAVLADLLPTPLLRQMLLCPLLYYGSAEEHDVDFTQFIILFNSIYREGFCRPRRGVRQILEVLKARYESLGGKLHMRDGVRRVLAADGAVTGVELESGQRLTASTYFSSAGRVETAKLSDFASDRAARAQDLSGQLSFTETIWVLDRPVSSLGHKAAITFFGRQPEFHWRRPEGPVDLESGVICCPGNYRHEVPVEHHLVRATHLANHRNWFGYGEQEYAKTKQQFIEASLDVVSRYVGDFKPHVTYVDSFTPRTVTHFTGHENGAVYGSFAKSRTGGTDLENLFLCGTDQGFVGIVGAMLSGIAMANAHALGAA